MARKQIQRRERCELNSHENTPRARCGAMTLTRPRPHVEKSLISTGAGVSAGQSKLPRTPPQPAKDGTLRWASVTSVSFRMREQEGRYRLVHLRAVKDSMAHAMRGSKQCKARSAMQVQQRGPQTRSTATALAAALGGKQNGQPTRTALPSPCKQCCLTPRSSGAPTAGHQRPVGGTRYIFTARALASCRRRPLSSNVRRHMNLPAHISILKSTGAALAGVGALDIAAMVYCIANGISYSSSFNIFALAAGVFLIRGNLLAASVVRWFSVLLLASLAAFAFAWPLAQPWDLTLTQVRLNPWQSIASVVLLLAVIGLLFWVQRNLGKPSVLAAVTAAGRKVRDIRVPAALGAALVVLIVALVPLLLSGESGKIALSMAETQLGKDFRYHVSSLRVTSGTDGTFVSAVVTAWNQVEIRTIPLSWRE